MRTHARGPYDASETEKSESGSSRSHDLNMTRQRGSRGLVDPSGTRRSDPGSRGGRTERSTPGWTGEVPPEVDCLSVRTGWFSRGGPAVLPDRDVHTSGPLLRPPHSARNTEQPNDPPKRFQPDPAETKSPAYRRRKNPGSDLPCCPSKTSKRTFARRASVSLGRFGAHGGGARKNPDPGRTTASICDILYRSAADGFPIPDPPPSSTGFNITIPSSTCRSRGRVTST